MLTNKQVQEYQRIYKGYYGKEISREEAFRQGSDLIDLLQLIYKPLTKEERIEAEKEWIRILTKLLLDPTENNS